MSFNFFGLNSVLDRTVFTNNGPIVKSPLPILSGSNLYVASPNSVKILTANFNNSYVGKTITVSGTPNGRNDGVYYIKSVKAFDTVVLDANLDYSDPVKITSSLVSFSNGLKSIYNRHILSTEVHGTFDNINTVTAQNAVDLASVCILLNDIKLKLSTHSILVGSPPQVHKFTDPDSSIFTNDANGLPSAVLLANALKFRYEQHRQDIGIHLKDDFLNRFPTPPITVYTGTGVMNGPFSWTVSDPRNGIVAHDPLDVNVLVNGNPAPVDFVYGLLGAVVLQNKPSHGDAVLVDYKYLKNPPTQLERLNSYEFVLNQENNRGISGVPGHLYRQRSYLINPGDPRLVKSPIGPEKIGYKYKGYELQYTARLNDPNSLLLNSPTNKLMYTILNESVFESVYRYDPISLPEFSSDPWTRYGEGFVSLVTNPSSLSIIDSSRAYGLDPGPPFYSHVIDLTYPSYISAAYRFKADYGESTYLEGDFNGIGFGFVIGQKSVIVGGLLTDANNLTSCITLANNIKAKYTNHINSFGVHKPIDTVNVVQIVNAYDLDSLKILTNHLVFLYNRHIALGPNSVHQNPDIVNVLLVLPVTNLDGCISTLNLLRSVFNSHLSASAVHYVNDADNYTDKIKQVGIYTKRGFIEDSASWNSFSYDWTIETTYRLHITPEGDSSVYLSGDLSPRCFVLNSELPDSSNVDLRFDSIQEAFFGAIGFNSTSSSVWRFSRIDIQPVDSVQILKNKNVVYDITSTPELYPDFPWITVGQGGSESLLPAKSLLVDSMAVVRSTDELAAGILTGEYRGYLRLEPSVTDRNTVSLEFRAYSPFSSFGVDNRSLGVHIGDGVFATQLCFLQANPSPAIVRGSVYEPSIAITTGDTAVFTVDNGPVIVVSSPFNITTVSALVSLFNSTAGTPVASAHQNPFTLSLTLQLSSINIGAQSEIRIMSGSIFDKLGITTGSFVYGNDSKPEPKVSWTGVDIPDLDNPAWVPYGAQSAVMKERTLVISDSSPSDYRSYNQSNTLVMESVLIGTDDWKSDIRVKVAGFTQGGLIASGPNFYFCGTVFNLDEGTLGKSLEIHLSKSVLGQPCVVVYSYDATLNVMNYVADFPFNWTDKNYHSYSLYTDKVNNLVSLFIDGIYFGNFTYSILNMGAYGPSITFGSGGNAANNGNLTTSQSVTEWSSVCVMHDSSVNNLSLAAQRYIGLYRGGDTTKLSSYYLSQIDWKQSHSYKIVRDPVSAVSVYIDGAPYPSISSTYDVLTLPLSTLEFLSQVVPTGRFIAFGAFNSHEISRSIWVDHISYSVGKINDTDGVVPPHQVLNKSNIISSPEHLSTTTQHSHYGFSSYSGGTPDDNFMSNNSVPAYAVLGTGTPPFQKSQDLDYMGGLVTSVTPIDTISAAQLIFSKGQISNFIDDLENVPNASTLLSYTDSLNLLIDDTNALRTRYLNHVALVSYVVPPNTYLIHQVADAINNIIPGPVAHGNFIGLVSTISALHTNYNQHLSQVGVHYNNDTFHADPALPLLDLPDCISAFQSISGSFNSHISSAIPHLSGGNSEDKLPFVISTLNLLRVRFSRHAFNLLHLIHQPFRDAFNATNMSSYPFANTLSEAIVLYNNMVSTYNAHLTNTNSHAGLTDVTNAVTNAIPTDTNTLYAAVLVFYSKYNDHLTNNGAAYHLILDTFNQLVPDTTVEYLVRYASSTQSLFNSHAVDTQLHLTADVDDQYLINLTFSLNGLLSYCNPSDYIPFVNDLKTHILNHLISKSHKTPDFVQFDYLTSIPNATSQNTAISLLLSIQNVLKLHNQTPVSNEFQAHVDVNSPNIGQNSLAYNPLPKAILETNILVRSILDHFGYKPSHVKIEEIPNVPTATDLVSMVVSLNLLKTELNTHYVHPGIHVRDDLVNQITAPNAFDLNSAIALLNDVLSKFNNHRVYPGVHSSSAIIRLTSPDGVLYDGIKFWTITSGTPGITSTYSDDETWYLDGFKNQKPIRLSYAAVALPENVSIVGSVSEPFINLPEQYIDIHIDSNPPIRVLFLPGDTSASLVVTRINATTGVPANFAAATTDRRIILTNPNAGTGRFLYVSGNGVDTIGFDTSSSIPWALTADNSSSVSVGVVSGFPDYLSYSTTGLGTKTAYVASTGLTDAPSLGFRITYRIKINSWSYLPNGETGIFVGCSSKSGPGFTVGIGFVDMSGTKAVILKDMNNGSILNSKIFNWGDGSFHEYTIEKDTNLNQLTLVIN